MKSLMLPALVFTILVIVSTTMCAEPAPLDCPENEEYYKCSLAKCYAKCEDARMNKPCPSISADCYKPSCECKDDMLRNNAGVCVAYAECD